MAVSRESCLSCLLKGMSDEAYEQTLERYIDNMDEDIKVPEVVYQERLSICVQCEFLRNGICRLCGCFVALRAAPKCNYCADTPAKWS